MLKVKASSPTPWEIQDMLGALKEAGHGDEEANVCSEGVMNERRGVDATVLSP